MASKTLESYPFDSKFDGYDDYGYPVYDRAVDSAALRAAFKQFFSNGIFGTPSTAFQITRGDGLYISIGAGECIIEGGLARIDSEGANLELESPQGKVAYGVYLRFDNNQDYRCIQILTRAGETGSDPKPTAPDTTTAAVYELRIGYVVVPSGATDLTEAEIVDERGTSVCPYAAPFVDIDTSEVLAELKVNGNKSISKLNNYIQEKYDYIEAAIDGSQASYLENRIDTLQQSLEFPTDTELIDYLTQEDTVE
jgi:hypothetical protein